jgi:hypothetical protein
MRIRKRVIRARKQFTVGDNIPSSSEHPMTFPNAHHGIIVSPAAREF